MQSTCGQKLLCVGVVFRTFIGLLLEKSSRVWVAVGRIRSYCITLAGLLSAVGAIFFKSVSQRNGVAIIVQLIALLVIFSWTSISHTCTLYKLTAAQGSAVDQTRLKL